MTDSKPLDPYIPDHAADVATDIADQVVPPVVVTTGTKAFVGAVVGALTTGGAALVQAIGDGTVTGGEWINVLVALAVGAGLVGPSVYASTNKRVVS